MCVELGREWGLGEFEDEDSEGLERWGSEECGGEGGFIGGAVVGKVFEVSELVDELVDVRDVRCGGETDACEERVTYWCWVW